MWICLEMLVPLRTPRLFFANLGTLMLHTGTLGAHLQEIERIAVQRHNILTHQFVNSAGIAEALKATDQMAWVQQMNAIDAQVWEIINEGADLRMMERYIQALQEYAQSHKPNFGDRKSVLTLLYKAYSGNNRMDNTQIKADFKELYRQLEDMDLRKMDLIRDPVCILCRDYEHGFVEDVKVGLILVLEML